MTYRSAAEGTAVLQFKPELICGAWYKKKLPNAKILHIIVIRETNGAQVWGDFPSYPSFGANARGISGPLLPLFWVRDLFPSISISRDYADQPSFTTRSTPLWKLSFVLSEQVRWLKYCHGKINENPKDFSLSKIITATGSNLTLCRISQLSFVKRGFERWQDYASE